MKNFVIATLFWLLLVSPKILFSQITGFSGGTGSVLLNKTSGTGVISNITLTVLCGASPVSNVNIQISDDDGNFIPLPIALGSSSSGLVSVMSDLDASSNTPFVVNIPFATPNLNAYSAGKSGYRFRIVYWDGAGSPEYNSAIGLSPATGNGYLLQELPTITIDPSGLLPGGGVGTVYCEGTPFTFGEVAGSFQKSAGGNFGGTNTFYLDISDKNGVFGTNWYQSSSSGLGSTVSSSPNVIYGSMPSSTLPVTSAGYTTAAQFGNGHKFRIRSSNPVTYSNEIGPYTLMTTPLPPSIPTNQWRAYVYSDQASPYIAFQRYSGYFNAGAANSFNSTSYYAMGNSPSSTVGYSGCTVGNDYHSVRYERIGFACGYYRFDLDIDNSCILYIDGVQVYSKNTSGAANDAWRCFLSPTTKVTLETSDKNSNSKAVLTLTKLANGLSLNSMSNPTICNGSSVSLNASTVTGANIGIGAMTYIWSPSTGLNTTVGASVIANPSSTTLYTVTATNTVTGCTDSRTVTVNVNATLITTVSPSSATICPGGSTTLTASGAATYTWSPATGLNTTTGATVIASPVSNQTYTVTGFSPSCASSSANVTVNVSGGIAAPVFGSSNWNVYAYSNSGSTAANGFAVLLGTYTENNLSFDTRTRWTQNSSPSSANSASGVAYTGCSVPNDYHSYKYMRTNFACGIYQITINSNDDNITLFVDGVQKYTRTGSGTSAQVWRGFLSQSSTIEIRTVELTGNSYTVVSVAPVNTITMANPIVCVNTPTTLTATTTPDGPEISTNTTYTWSGPAGLLSSYSGSTVNFLANATPGIYSFDCTASNSKAGVLDETCNSTSTITVTVINAAPLGNISPASTTICGGANVTLTASGGNFYKWYYLDSTKIKDGTVASAVTTNFGTQPLVWKLAGVAGSFLNPVTGTLANLSSSLASNVRVVAAPPFSMRYGVEISVGGTCSPSYSISDVFIGTPSNPNNFIKDAWYAYVFNGNNFQNYYGYYTIADISFDTADRWAANSRASAATGNNPAIVGSSITSPGVRYIGACALPGNDNFSLNFKRQGFPCGFYRISFPVFNDDINLKIGIGDPVTNTKISQYAVAGFPKVYTGAAFNNVWQGFLGENSQVEMTLKEYTGAAQLKASFQDISSLVSADLIKSSALRICRGTESSLFASLSANVPNSLVYHWEAFISGTSTPYPNIQFYDSTNTVSTSSGRRVIVRIANTAIDGDEIDIRCTVSDPVSGSCSIYQLFPKMITISDIALTSLTQDRTTVCSGEYVTFVASGSNFYDWSLASGSDGTFRFPNATGTINPNTQYPANVVYTSNIINNYGSIALYTPGSLSNYSIQVKGSNGVPCAAFASTANQGIVNIIVNDPGYGNGVWNVVCYNGTSPVISTFATGSLGINIRGIYREEELSFNTQARWDKSLAPSLATVNIPTTCPSPYPSCGYEGCSVDNDNHTIIYKRTGIACNIYRLDLGDFSNAQKLDIMINGVLVFTSPGGLPKFNAWNGSLSPSDKIELRYFGTIGDSYFSVNFAVIPPPASSIVWTGGGGNSDWKNLNNWCAGLPEKITDVYIPLNILGNYPVINDKKTITLANECNDLRIDPSASLTISPNFELNVYGHIINNGVLNASSSSIVRLKGIDSVNIGGSSVTAFGRLQLAKSGGIVSLGQDVVVNTSLDLNSAQFQLNEHKLTLNASDPDSLFRANGSFILSETKKAYNPSNICWNLTGAMAGKKFEFPFGTSFSNYIPVYFTKNTNQDYTICASTRATPPDNKLFAQNQASTWTASISDPSLIIDRWWDISSSVNPLSGSGANIELSYGYTENTLPATTSLIGIFHFDPANNAWDPIYPQASVPVTVGIGTAKANNISKFSPHVIGDVDAALPVSLVDFSAKIIGKQVKLTWETATEINNNYFAIERSKDAQNFETIAKINSKLSNSVELMSYDYLDEQPYHGTSYYRLKETDMDGNNAYSRILSVLIGVEPELILAPNPATTETLSIFIQGEPGAEVKFSIKNLDGQLVYSDKILIESDGRILMKWKTGESLEAGVYICSMQIGAKMISKKLILN